MTEEEKKARDILVNEIADILIGKYCKQCKICDNENIECYYSKAIDTIDNLIKKQQKEIEERNTRLQEEINENCKLKTELYGNSISKDKIREHLKKFEEIEKEFIFIDNKSTAREINKALIEFSKRLLEE